MRECNFTNPRLLRVIAAAIMAQALPDTPVLMVENWRQYVQIGEYLRFTWSPRKFFADGHWANWRLWPIDQARMKSDMQSRVGARRL